MIRYLLLFVFLHSFIILHSQVSKEELVKGIKKNPPSDIFYYYDAYALINDIQELNSYFSYLNAHIIPEQRRYNEIAYIKQLINLQYPNLAIELIEQKRELFEVSSSYIRAEFMCTQGVLAAIGKEDKKAIDFYQEALKLLEGTDFKKTLQGAYMNLGTSFSHFDDYTNARTYYDKAIALELDGVTNARIPLRINYSILEYMAGNKVKSVDYILDAKKLAEQDGLPLDQLSIYNIMAVFYWEDGDLQEAEESYLSGIELAKLINNKTQEACINKNISEFYYAQNDIEKALIHLQRCDSIEEFYPIQKYSEKIVASDLNYKIEKERIENEKKDLEIKVKEAQLLINYVIVIALLTLVIILGYFYKSLQRKNKVLVQQNLKIVESQKKKEVPSVTQESEVIESLISKLEEYVISKKGFEHSNLTLERLAKKLNTNRSYLSEAINHYYKLTFTKWINEVRIDEARKMLASNEYDHFSIEGIAQTVGYANLSTFNASFKRITGITPSYFRKTR